MTVHGGVEPAVLPAECLAADLHAAADVLDGGGVEHQTQQGRKVQDVVRRNEAIDERAGRRRTARRGFAFGLAQSGSAAMDRRLHRADGRPEHVADLLETHLEDVLQHHGGSLLWREPLQHGGAGVAHRAGSCSVGDRRSACAASRSM